VQEFVVSYKLVYREENMKLFVFFVAAVVLVAWPCHGAGYQRFPLRMKTGYGERSSEVKCASFRLAVEAHNIRAFKTIPEECVEPTKDYINGEQFRSDSKTVNQQAFFYASEREVHHNDIFIFGIDNTVLSNIPYYEKHGYGYVCS